MAGQESATPSRSHVADSPAASPGAPDPARAATPALDELLTSSERSAIQALGARDLGQMLRLPPRRYVVPGPLRHVREMHEGEEISALVTVETVSHRRMRTGSGELLSAQVSDGGDSLTLTFFLRRRGLVAWHEGRLRPGTRILVQGTVGTYRGERQITHPQYEVMGEGGIDLAEATRPLPVYPLRGGAKQSTLRSAYGKALAAAATLPDPVPPSILARRDLLGIEPALRALHHPATLEEAAAGRRRLAFEEALVLQSVFAQRRAADELTPAPPLTAAGPLQEMLIERLPFTLTAGQQDVRAGLERLIARDMPTSVLLQGDVGSGKTVLALLAMLRAVDSGHQAALLAPTEVLAEQHHRTITDLLGELGHLGQLDAVPESTAVRLLTGSQRTAQRRRTLLDVTSGEAGIVVGTHALLTESVGFASLGLVVIDEQHRFGVDHRRRLRTRGPEGRSPHVVVMTATPIPRSAALATVGDLDVLTLRESPSRRAGTESHVVHTSRPDWMARMAERMREEVDAGRQVFVVCPRIGAADADPSAAEGSGDEEAQPQGVEATAAQLRADPRFADLRIQELHGRMSSERRQEVMEDMAAGRIDILVATTVIEVGVDVPNASTLVVMDAERFGVSQLHQLRGRVGRGEHPGIAFFVTTAPVESETTEHLRAIAATQDGFALAQLDLDRRGVGDLVGTEQSGLHRTLRHLDVMREAEIIEAARTDAREIVGADPELDAHPALAQAIEDRLADVDPDVERS